jgi:hypothetical protein
MILLHCDTPAAIANKLHGRQFVFADMFGIDLGRTAETAFFLVVARVTEVTGRFGHGTTIFTSVSHWNSP